MTERVKLIFRKIHKFLGQLFKRFLRMTTFLRILHKTNVCITTFLAMHFCKTNVSRSNFTFQTVLSIFHFFIPGCELGVCLDLQSLSKISMRIPTFVQSGETADLTCSYYLDSNSLYSIKWYKVSILT